MYSYMYLKKRKKKKPEQNQYKLQSVNNTICMCVQRFAGWLSQMGVDSGNSVNC